MFKSVVTLECLRVFKSVVSLEYSYRVFLTLGDNCRLIAVYNVNRSVNLLFYKIGG